jgi:hypothetical protein
MAELSINVDELKELRDKVEQLDNVKNLELTNAQRDLLEAILRVAWQAVEKALADEFKESFEPGQARLAVAYGVSDSGSIRGLSIRGLSIKPAPHP